MDTLLNRNDWNFIENPNTENQSKCFEELIKRYLNIAKQPETKFLLPNRKNIDFLDSIINNNYWIYQLNLDSNTPAEKIKTARFNAFFNLLNSIGMLEDYYKIFGQGIQQDRIITKCYVDLANEHYKTFIQLKNKTTDPDIINLIDLDKTKKYILFRDLTCAIVGQQFISEASINYRINTIDSKELENNSNNKKD